MENGREERLLLAIIRDIACDKEAPAAGSVERAGVDWDKFRKISAFHEISSFIYPAIKEWQRSIPGEATEYYRQEFYFSFAESGYLLEEFLRICDEFRRAGVLVVPIKGIAFLTDIYAGLPVRPMCDIDLLIKDSDLAAAKGILVNMDMGYTLRLDGLKEEYWINHQCHLPFHRVACGKRYNVDLHFALDFKRKGRAILPGVWERVLKRSIEGRMVNVLSPEDALFGLALHLRRYGKILNLKNVLDIALILNKYSHNLDWEYIIRESRHNRICSTVFFAILQAYLFFDSFIPDYTWRGLGVPSYKKRLMRTFILGHTFSNGADPKRIYMAAYFLLFDSIGEPIENIFRIPLEQFAKYYNLKAYCGRTAFFYRHRILYIPYKFLRGLFYAEKTAKLG